MAEKYISDEKAIKDILDIGQRMYYAGFAAANDGNISVRTGKKRRFGLRRQVYQKDL